jgi:hypothetical protein
VGAGELLGRGDAAVGEQAVVDMAKSLWAARARGRNRRDKVAGLQRHDLVPLGALDAAILVFERGYTRVG